MRMCVRVCMYEKEKDKHLVMVTAVTGTRHSGMALYAACRHGHTNAQLVCTYSDSHWSRHITGKGVREGHHSEGVACSYC